MAIGAGRKSVKAEVCPACGRKAIYSLGETGSRERQAQCRKCGHTVSKIELLELRAARWGNTSEIRATLQLEPLP